MTESPHELAEEIETWVHDALGDLLMVRRATSEWTAWEEAMEGHPELDQYKMSIIHGGRALGGWTRAEWRTRLTGPTSPVFARLTQNWIVTSFTQWEDHYRARLRAALGTSEPPSVPFFGDLRLLRNDIVHHRGTATADSADKCAIFTWFEPGDPIVVDDAMIKAMIDELTRWVGELNGTSSNYRNARKPKNKNQPTGGTGELLR